MFLDFLNIGLLNFVFLCLKVLNSSAFPEPLPKDEERSLFISARSGSEKARSRLIEHNLRLVAHIIKKYYTAADDQEDLISIGTIGLIKAIDSFDVENGTKFATYAGRCVQNEILMYFRAQKKNKSQMSISDVIDTDKDGNALTIMDILASDDDIIDEIDLKTKTSTALRALEECLDPREKKIIVMRYGLSGNRPVTQRETSELLGISRSYVSRIEKSALEKMEKYLKKNERKF